MPLDTLQLDHLPPWLLLSLGYLGVLVLLILVKYIILARVEALIARTPFFLDSLIISSLKRPLDIIILAISLWPLNSILSYYLPNAGNWDQYFSYTTRVLLILSMIIFVERTTVGAIKKYSESSELLKNSRGLVTGVSRTVIIGLGVLIVLGTLGVSITPIIASLGISSLAVALALQPTLENFFSGVQLVADKPIRVGDFIELDSGEQGFVEKIGWRSTWIKMLPNNTVIMPNSVLSQSKIINYYYPVKELSVPVEVGVHYDSDLDHVERVTLEVAREVLHSHEMAVPSFEPFMNYHTFDSSSINFTVILRGKEYFNRFFITSAFIKKLHKRYAEEGIVIPYPIRALNISQEKAALFSGSD
ncbi:mechanosensitive ion channel family protein [Halioxenophilus sp. WMMB6]|uniref:mechanosensitive ion channel family protein n=1 Tax=Halioxenophilus sp. WMMB6 TaxID=3073815 RepID=UPI00295E6E7C|nr:mechanosensitive ion channel family protein [Halioxenophilus sp. WMMB6]